MKPYFFFLLLATFILQPRQTFCQNEELTKADSLFKSGAYDKALPIIEHLLKKYPKEGIYHFYHGRILQKLRIKPESALNSLKIATVSENIPNEAYYFLGELYQERYQFEKAISYYMRLKKFETENDSLLQQTDNRINECRNGLSLLQYIHKLNILDLRTVNEENLINEINNTLGEFRILNKVKELYSEVDLVYQKEFSLMLFPENIDVGEALFYSSYGENIDNGLDVYKIVKQEDGTFSLPERLNSIINTSMDEDFPFFDKKNQCLYFASKGHYSFGKYDLYKSKYNAQNDTWSSPENLDFPINSSSNDFLFIPLENKKTAYVLTDRDARPSYVHLVKFELDENATQKEPNTIEEIMEYAKLSLSGKRKTNVSEIIKKPKKKLNLEEAVFLKEDYVKSEADVILDKALALELKIDSANQEIDKLRAVLAHSQEDQKENISEKIVKLEKETYTQKKELDELYIKIRAHEKEKLEQEEVRTSKEISGNEKSSLMLNKSFTQAFGNLEPLYAKISMQKEALKIHFKQYLDLENHLISIYDDDPATDINVYEAEIKTFYTEGIKLSKNLIATYTQLISMYDKGFNQSEINNPIVSDNISKAGKERFNIKLISNNIVKEKSIEYYNSNLELIVMYDNTVFLYEIAASLKLGLPIEKREVFNAYAHYNSYLPLTVKLKTNQQENKQMQADSSLLKRDSTEIIRFNIKEEIVEFEIRENNYYTQENPIQINTPLPEKLIYRIQLGAFSSPKNPVLFRGMYPISADQKNGSKVIVYYAGLFHTYASAEKQLPEIRKRGFKDAFVVPFYKGTRTNLKRAKLLEEPVEEIKQSIYSIENTSNTNKSTQYRIQIVSIEFLNKNLTDQIRKLAPDKEFTRTVKNSKEIIYNIGNFNTFEDAEGLRNLIINLGLKNVKISEVDLNQ